MITLEQIRLLESKITRAIDLIRVLKEENSTLRKGLESAQRRMRELETLVDGFKTDQKEIESVIVRTLHNLDELEESAATPGGISAAVPAAPAAAAAPPSASGAGTSAGIPAGVSSSAVGGPTATGGAAFRRAEPKAMAEKDDAEPPSPKEELDIF
jgi:FtsZ-binding cell division protein ZapB